MTTLGKRLKLARKNKQLSQKALAELAGIKQQAVQRIERGDVKNSCYIVELAHALEVTPDWLAAGKEWRPPITYAHELAAHYTPAQVNQAPLLAWDEIDQMQNLPEKIAYHTNIPIFNDRDAPCFVLQLNNNSMQSDQSDSSSFLEDDLIFVDTSRAPLFGDFVIAKLPNVKDVIFRRYTCLDKDKSSLTALNPDYTAISMTPEINIIGVVFMRYTKLC